MSLVSERNDLLEDRRFWLALWGIPQLVFVAAFFLSAHRTLLWTASLIVLGVACLLNAVRCGRLHCYLTGPFYLLGAAAVVANEAAILPLGDRGWLWIGVSIIAGGNLLAYLPERFWGQYMGAG